MRPDSLLVIPAAKSCHVMQCSEVSTADNNCMLLLHIHCELYSPPVLVAAARFPL